MPQVPILMPQLGESITEATIMRLLVQPGDTVEADQEVFEVETNKAVMGVTTECGGTVVSMLASEGETIAVGTVMGIIEATAEEIERSGATPLAEGELPAAPAPKNEPVSGAGGNDGAHFRTEGEYREAAAGSRIPSRYSSCATTKLAVVSLTSSDRKIMRSLSSREKMSKLRSPRLVCSTT